MDWTVLAIAWMAAGSATLAWLVVLVVRRARAAHVRTLPAWQRVSDLVIDGIALPVLLVNGGLSGAWVPLLAVGIALTLWTFARRSIASLVIPATLVGIGLNGFLLVRGYARGEFFHGQLWPGGQQRHRGAVRSALAAPGLRVHRARALAGLAEAGPGSPGCASGFSMSPGPDGEPRRPRWGLLLLPMVAVVVDLLGRTWWLGMPWWTAGLTLFVAFAALALVVRVPALAADLSIAGMMLIGLYGVALAAWWPTHIPLPSPYTTDVRYVAFVVDSRATALLAGGRGSR